MRHAKLTVPKEPHPILFAFSWSTMERVREMARDPERIRPQEKRENIEAALRELVGLREGSFQFELTAKVSDKLGEWK